MKDFFESLKECPSLSAIGAQPRMVSWFSLNTNIKFLLPGFTLNQQGFLSYEDAGPLEEPAAVIDGAAAKAHYSEKLRRLKKVCNRIALAAKLLTPWLRHEMMLYMKVTDAHWLAFGTLASLKLNGENHRKYVHKMATGQWYFVLRESLINVIQTTSTLETLGVTLGDNCGEENALQEQRDRCSRLLEVALAITGFRADSLGEHDSSYSMRFALVFSDSLEQQRAAVRSFKEHFHFLLQMEERARGDDGLLEVLRHIVWRQDPLVLLLFMLWDRPRGDEIDTEAFEVTKQMFDHQGDTRLNEEPNRLCKQNTDYQSHSVCSETRDQYACIMGDILQHRKLGTTWEPDLEDSSVKLPSVSKLWRPPHDLRMEWSSILFPDRKFVISNTRKRTCRVCCLAMVAASSSRRAVCGCTAPLESLGQLVVS